MAKRKTELELSLIDNVTRGLRNIEKGVSGLGATLAKANQALELTGRAVRAIDTVTGFSAAIQSARDFQSAMAAVQVVTGAAGDELQELRDAAEAASAASVFSATESAQGLAELARAGQTAKEAIATLTPVLQLAQGQQLAVADAASVVTKTLTQFRLEADQAARVTDVLAKTADSTEASVESLARALTDVAPVAAELDLTLEQTVAVIGQLASAGFDGSRAATALRNAYVQMIDPASKFARALREAGIEATSTADLLEQLSKQADGGRSVLLALGQEALPALLALNRQGSGALNELTATLEKATGANQRAADVYGEQFDAAAAKFTNAIDRIRRTVATPILEGISDDVTVLAEKLQEFAQSESFVEITRQIGEFASESAAAIIKFAEEFDFTAAIAQAKTFAVDSEEAFRKIAAAASLVVDAAGFIGSAYAKLNTAIIPLIRNQIEVGSAVSQLATDLVTGGTALRLYREAQDATADSSERLVEKQEQLAKVLPQIKQPSQELIDDFRKVMEAVRGLELAVVTITPTMYDYAKAILEAEAAGDGEGAAMLRVQMALLAEKLAAADAAAKGASKSLSELKTSIRAALEAGNNELAAKLANDYKIAAAASEDLDAKVEKLIGTQQKAAASTADFGTAAAGAASQIGGAAKEINQTAEAADRVGSAMGQATGAAAAIASRIQGLRREFGFSTAAADLFEQQLDKVNRRFLGSSLSTSIGAYVAALEAGASATRRAIQAQADLADQFEAGLGIAALQGDLEATTEALRGMEAETRNAQGRFRLLSEQRLDKLRSEINATISAIERQQQAVQSLIDINRQLQDDADRRAGNEDEIAERRYQDDLKRIAELEAAGGASARAAAEEARRRAKENHEAELREIRERAAEQRRQDSETQQARSSSRQREREQEREQTTRAADSGGLASAGSVSRGGVSQPIQNITLNYGPLIGDLGSQEGVDRLVRTVLIPAFATINRRSN